MVPEREKLKNNDKTNGNIDKYLIFFRKYNYIQITSTPFSFLIFSTMFCVVTEPGRSIG